jgi:hypothetical protein
LFFRYVLRSVRWLAFLSFWSPFSWSPVLAVLRFVLPFRSKSMRRVAARLAAG